MRSNKAIEIIFSIIKLDSEKKVSYIFNKKI